MSTKLDTSHTSPNQNTRPGTPTFIVLHHWGSRGQKFDNVRGWLCNPVSNVSAHYVAGAGQRARIVALHKRAWHGGTDYANDYGIAIEARPEATDSDYALVAECVREIRDEYGDLPIKVHKDFVPTQCPGVWDVARLDRLARGSAAPAPAVKPDGSLTVDGRFGRVTVRALQEWLNREHGAGLVVDGKAGRATWRALQAALDAPYVDGEISRQSYAAHELGNGITQGWEHTGRGSRGSQTVELLQALVGAGVDGTWFEGTSAALQRWLNTQG